MSVSISAFYPDTSLKESQFAQAVTAAAIALARNRDHTAQQCSPEIELVFMLSGKFDAPCFEGMRISRFDSKIDLLVIEAAVPEKIIHSEIATAYVKAALLDALENASAFLLENEISFNLQEHQQLMACLEERVSLQ